MFRCTQGHLSKAGEKQVLVTVRVRQVEYFEMATNNKGLSHPHLTYGHEPVQELPYCIDHADTAPPPTWLNSKTIKPDKKVHCEAFYAHSQRPVR